LKERKLILAERAYQMLEADCLAHPRTETGGLLVGRIADGDFVVPFVVPAGPAAERHRSRFSPDCATQQQHLDYLHARFRTDFVGDYHRHPGSFDRPSTTDLRTARHIVTSEQWNKPEAIFPIVVIEDGLIRLRAYLLSRDSQDFTEMPYEIVEDTDPRLRTVLLTRNPNEKGPINGNGTPTGHRARGARTHPLMRRLARGVRVLPTR
jgi:integrative and conjugative element protein (TIGR02256 family)